jgi:parvulin-like peptidyl-prolyl isomerase
MAPTSSPALLSHRVRTFCGRSFPALAGAVLLLAGCHPRVTDPRDPKFIIAEKDKWQITQGELDQQVAAYMKQNQMTAQQIGPEKMPILQTAMLDNMVLQKLVLAKGATMPLKDVDKNTSDMFDKIKSRTTSDADFQSQLKAAGLTPDALKQKIHDQVVATKVLEAEAFSNYTPSDQEVSDFYVKFRDRYFVMPPKIRASRVLIMVDEHTSPAEKAAKKKTIDQAHDRVAHGEDFSKVALEVSEDRYSSPRGGDIGFFQKGENEPEFEAVAFKSKVGVLSPVFETPMGYQFLKVTDTQGGVVPEAEARPAISAFLKKNKEQDEERAYTTKLLADSGVTYHFARAVLPQADPAEASPAENASAPMPDGSASTKAPSPGK